MNVTDTRTKKKQKPQKKTSRCLTSQTHMKAQAVLKRCGQQYDVGVFFCFVSWLCIGR
eukprot:m.269026 g.269026  ORF g.269026 m.269026 type:complete len:58 (-) comp76137_c0_seq1:29-202(-)